MAATLNPLYTWAAAPNYERMVRLMRRVAAGGTLLAVLLLWAPRLDAAPGAPPPARFAIDVWRTEDGLPQSSVIAMTLSRDGYLWLGTLSGLVRFDGFRFPVFDESTPGLTSSRIVHLFEDSHGHLWIGTETAGIVLARRDGSLTNIALGRAGREGRLMGACEDSRGGVWLYTADGQLGCYRDGHLVSAPVDETQFSYCRSLDIDDEGRILAGTDERIYIMAANSQPDRQSWEKVERERIRYRKLDYLLASRRGGHWRIGDGRIQRWTSKGVVEDLGPYPWRQDRPDPWTVAVSAASEDPSGHLLIATLGAGLFWFQGDGKVTQLSTNEGLASNFLLSLQFDREGTLWVGTDGDGLNQVRRQLIEVLEPTRGRVVQSVCEDARGGVWLGYNSGGVDEWRDGDVRGVDTGENMLNMSVKAVFVSRNQRTWAGTESPIRPPGLFQLAGQRFQRVVGSPLYNRDVAAIFEDRSGRLWVGTRSGLVCWDPKTDWKAFTTAEGLSANAVSALAEARDGALWIGTRGGGLNRMHQGKFTAFHKSDGLPSEEVSSLYVDADDVLWVGTDGGGLARYKSGRWRSFSKSAGLISNNIAYLLEDEQGYLWLGSTAGLMRVFKKTLNDLAERNASSRITPTRNSNGGAPANNEPRERGDGLLPLRVYGVSDGLPNSECTQGSQPAACRTRSGQLLFPTVRGLATVEPTQLRANTNPPPVSIESVLVEGRPQGPEGILAPRLSRLTVPAGQEHVEIHYTSLNLAAAKLARFRYRLENHDNAWVDAGGTRSAHYSKLPPGQYLFRVSACNEDGVWNEAGATLAIIIEPPIWRTWWFLTASSVALLGAVVGLVRYFSVQKLARQLAVMRQQEALEKERARIARDIHDQLGASLTQVALLGELVEADKAFPEEIEAHAKQICQTARDTTRTLDEIVWTVNPSNDSLEGLANYICKYAQDYFGVAGVRYRLEVPPALPSASIPPEVRHNIFLAAKEAITNVVRHAHATSAWVRLKHDPDRFTFEIADDGRGLGGMDPQRAATRNGLRNMRKRMEDVGGQFEMGPAPEGGLQVRLTVPVAK